MTVEQYIRTETSPDRLYDGIRAILLEMDRRGKYPEDWQIKRLQRLADARYEILTKEEKNT